MQKNYIAKEGSTIIILKTDYLKTLSVGTHSFEIVWADGSAVTSFKVSKNTSDNEGSKTTTVIRTTAMIIQIVIRQLYLMTRKLMTVTVEIIQTTASR